MPDSPPSESSIGTFVAYGVAGLFGIYVFWFILARGLLGFQAGQKWIGQKQCVTCGRGIFGRDPELVKELAPVKGKKRWAHSKEDEYCTAPRGKNGWKDKAVLLPSGEMRGSTMGRLGLGCCGCSGSHDVEKNGK